MARLGHVTWRSDDPSAGAFGAVIGLDHYFVRVNDLERSRRFYCEVLGFAEMPRPDFPFPGYWLGVDGGIQVHMGPRGTADAQHPCYGKTERSATHDTGVIDHIAFVASEPESFARRFDAIGLEARVRYVPQIRLLQIFVSDPDGLSIELNFPGTAAELSSGTGSWTDTQLLPAAEKAK